MIRSACLFASMLVIAPALRSAPAEGAVTPVTACDAAKIEAVRTAVSWGSKCILASARLSEPASTCGEQVPSIQDIPNTFDRIEAHFHAVCTTIGDGIRVHQATRDFIDSLAVRILPFRSESACTEKKIRTVGSGAAKLIRAFGKVVRMVPSADLFKADTDFGATTQKSFAKAEERPPCQTRGDADAISALTREFVSRLGSVAMDCVDVGPREFAAAAFGSWARAWAHAESRGYTIESAQMCPRPSKWAAGTPLRYAVATLVDPAGDAIESRLVVTPGGAQAFVASRLADGSIRIDNPGFAALLGPDGAPRSSGAGRVDITPCYVREKACVAEPLVSLGAALAFAMTAGGTLAGVLTMMSAVVMVANVHFLCVGLPCNPPAVVVAAEAPCAQSQGVCRDFECRPLPAPGLDGLACGGSAPTSCVENSIYYRRCDGNACMWSTAGGINCGASGLVCAADALSCVASTTSTTTTTITLVSTTTTTLPFGVVHLFDWGTLGAAAGQFHWPAGIAVAADGTVYVAESGNDRVQHFDADGAYLGMWGGRGVGPGEFKFKPDEFLQVDLPGPASIALDHAGHVFVGDHGNSRVQKLSLAGMWLGEVNLGVGYWFGGVAVDETEVLHVAANTRLLRYRADDLGLLSTGNVRLASAAAASPSGNVVYELYNFYDPNVGGEVTALSRMYGGSQGDPSLWFDLGLVHGVAADDDGAVFILRAGGEGSIVSARRPDDTILAEWRVDATGSGGAIAVRNGRVYIADTGGNRVLVYSRPPM